ncbi:hypothetical protein [Marinobacter salicampi]|uniref:hypothetical protein n=1 Tax=Marinobacter salicampi TaxID=435907 RepID=UPI00140E23A0|nr:hypothetical protein [Marinobacter salicampi]
MEDWQGCLSPRCQTALQQARASVLERGGSAITVEDFLLALVEGEPSTTGFLRRQGIDLDELVRTIQCEQPIVTQVNSDGLLAPQLQYWFALSRELCSEPWLDWPVLLQSLTCSADRLSGKAYVAVLEQISHWPPAEGEDFPEPPADADFQAPVVMTESEFLQLAEDIAVLASARPKALVWLTGARGSGKTAWLTALAPSLRQGLLCLDLRAEQETMASGVGALPWETRGAITAPLLILDNTSPADLLTLMADSQGIARHMLPGHTGPILLLSPHCDTESVTRLEQVLGRPLSRLHMPRAGASQLLAILTAHQPGIEKRWGVELTDSALRYAGSASALSGMTPGQALDWVSRAAARVALVAERGPLASSCLGGEADTLHRQLLVALARQRSVTALQTALEELAVERSALEVDWLERQAAGELRQVTVDDLKFEQERSERMQLAPDSESRAQAELTGITSMPS